jgi:hypothetical protein
MQQQPKNSAQAAVCNSWTNRTVFDALLGFLVMQVAKVRITMAPNALLMVASGN